MLPCDCAVGTRITTVAVLRQHGRVPCLLLRGPCVVVRRRLDALAPRDPPTLSIDAGRPRRHPVRPSSCRAGAGRVRPPCRRARRPRRCRSLPSLLRDAAARRQGRLRRGHRRRAASPRTSRRHCAAQTRLERPTASPAERHLRSPNV